jgi:chromosome transmission fidelity protein 18
MFKPCDAGNSPSAAGTPGDGGSKAGKPQFSKLYRFNEGYTNAVKRPLLMKDLL